MYLIKIDKRPVSVLIPYYLENGKAFVFLQKRSPDAKRLPSFFGFFGGGLEPNESPEQGLKREIKEELGIDISNYDFFAHYEFVGAIMDVYAMRVKKSFVEETSIGEGEFGKFFDYSEMIESSMIVNKDKLILSNFFGYSEHQDPFFYKA